MRERNSRKGVLTEANETDKTKEQEKSNENIIENTKKLTPRQPIISREKINTYEHKIKLEEER